MKVNPDQKTCCKQKKTGWYWLHTMHYSHIPVFLTSTKEKKSIKRIWTISNWQIHKDHYQKFLSGHRIDDRFSYAIFEIYFQAVFCPNSFFYFFGFNIVCQLLARHLSKEKIIQIGLNHFLLKSDHPLHVRI